MMVENLIEVRGLNKTFTVSRGIFFRRAAASTRAVNDVSLDIRKGEVLGCVGGSGSGKSTLGRMIIRLIEPDSGDVRYAGQKLGALSREQLRAFRKRMQIVFQDPLQSLNPRRTIAENVERPLLNFGTPRAVARRRVEELLDLVGLDPTQSYRYPHEYSGGQCQRVAIARALALEPEFLFLDEPVSALDVSIQAQILNLLADLRKQLNLTFLFVSHDLKIVKQFCDRTIVMYRGRVLETGSSEAVYREPKHPFTRDFLRTVLHVRGNMDWEAAAERAEDLEGASGAGASACAYSGNCTECFARCRQSPPPLIDIGAGRSVACFLHADR
jgi:peptide/nickel transport system ATP-binding protein/oligopeptide transport system ATP-binding protein